MQRHAPSSKAPDTRPFLKWLGGKRDLVPRILAALPAGARLIDPFVGAGALFIKSDFDRYLLGDINPDLVNLYSFVADDCKSLLDRCRQLFVVANRSEDAYLRLRRAFNQAPIGLERAALFIYLNRHGYNGLCRYNRRGEFNASWGHSTSPPLLLEGALQHFALKLKHAQLVCGDFADVMTRAKVGDVCLCDCPYAPREDGASFVGYTPNGFTWSDHVRLTSVARELAARGVPVAIFNHDTADTRALYEGARIHEFSVRRSVGATKGSLKRVDELLAVFGRSRRASRA